MIKHQKSSPFATYRVRVWFREQECVNVTEKEKQNGKKGPRVMGMIMYASCRAGSSSSVGTKPFRNSLLFQKSFETFAALVRLGYFHTTSRCRSVCICFFISSMFLFFFRSVSPLSSTDHIAVLSLSSNHSWRKEGVCDGHVEAALSYSSRVLDKGRATAAGTERVSSFSWYQTALCHSQATTFCFHGLN